MRVLFLVTDVFSRGGIQRYSRHQVRALRELNGDAKLTVLSLLKPAPHGFEGAVEVEPWTSSSNKWLRNVRYTWRALRLAREKWFDLVLCNHVSLTPVAALIKRLVGTPYCVNTYGMEVWSGLSRSRMAGLRNADGIFPDCRFTRDYLVHELKLAPEKITVLEDCVDTERFTPLPQSDQVRARLGISADRKVLITVSRIVSGGQYKGHERVMRALREHCRDLPLEYLIVGDGDDRARLEALAGEWGLRDVCRFTGAVTDDELVDLYRASDLGILVSERGPGKGEGIPLALLEASACGKPIIAGHYDGSAEAVLPNVTGLVVDSLDIEAVAGAIRRVVTDASLAQSMGRAGRQRIETSFAYRQFRDRLGRYLDGAWSVRKYATAPLTLRRS